jgi:membrane-associated phospholipid phosphatase
VDCTWKPVMGTRWKQALRIALLSTLVSAGMFGQQTQSDKAAAEKNREAAAAEGSETTLTVKPGAPTIKTKDIEEEKKIAPWKRLPRYVLQDQKAIWTSPFHTAKSDVKWWVIFAGATAALVATDKTTSRQLPNTDVQVSVATWTSRLGAAYSLLPISGGFYFVGLGAKNERFRETGILGFEALAASTLVENAIKLTTRRERPLDGNGNGDFWSQKASFWNASFPSGHAINAWALASVVAHEYRHPLIVPIIAYGLATTVDVSRLAARRHFASDVLIGSGMGWFIGDYIYVRRHNRDLDPKESALQKLMNHVHIGGPQVAPQLDDPDAVRAAAAREVDFTAGRDHIER